MATLELPHWLIIAGPLLVGAGLPYSAEGKRSNSIDRRTSRSICRLCRSSTPIQTRLVTPKRQPRAVAILLRHWIDKGHVQGNRPPRTVEQDAKPTSRSAEPENDSLLAAETRSRRIANDHTFSRGPFVPRSRAGACQFGRLLA